MEKQKLEQIYKMIAEAHNFLVQCDVRGQSVFNLANAMARTQNAVDILEKEISMQSQEVPTPLECIGDENANN